MKPYACNPAARTRYYTPFAGFPNHPYRTSAPDHSVARSTHPGANIMKSETGFQIQLAIPGIPKENVKVEIHEDQLVITATNPNQESKTKFVRYEFDYTNFKRSFRLPKNVDTVNLKAAFEQGVLTIELPLKQPETRNIEIQ